MGETQGWADRPRLAGLLRRLATELDASQWEPPAAHAERRGAHLGRLFAHARARVPFYAERLDGVEIDPHGRLDPGGLARIPILTRAEAQAAGPQLLAVSLPAGHGGLAEESTTGSTGRPLRVTLTESEMLHRMAISVRRHRWSGRDAGGRMAAIRFMEDPEAGYPAGIERAHWDAPIRLLEPTGPMHLLDIDTPVSRQLEWLIRIMPDYLITYPTNLRALLAYSAQTGDRPTSLRGVGTFSEALPEGLHEVCGAVWGVTLVDSYSAVETGAVASQCPGGGCYHVHDEQLLVEVVDERGLEVPAGEVGRIVVTPLFNYAMPFIRYAIGDYARRGGPCRCGRGLSVIEGIAGRTRNMLRLPSGDRVWPQLGVRRLTEEFPIEQFQIAQTALLELEARLVTSRPLDEDEQARLRQLLVRRLGDDYSVAVRYQDSIPRTAGMKLR
jgi:phenylacetate-CoA ligase